MNKSYKVVFSRVRGGMVVASEAASCPRKKTVKTVIAVAAAAAVMSVFGAGAAEYSGAQKEGTQASGITLAHLNASNGDVSSSEDTFADNTLTFTSTAGSSTAVGIAVQNGNAAITGSTFTNNVVADGEGSANGVYGSAVGLQTGKLTVTDATFTSNKATSYRQTQGSAIYQSVGTVEIGGTTSFTGNEAYGVSGTDASATGGAVSLWGTSGTISATFNGNKAQADETAYGGALYLRDGRWGGGNDLTITVKDSSFIGNSAIGSKALGGGLYAKSTHSESGDYVLNLNIENTTFQENSATHMGGGAFVTGNGKLTMTNVTFEGNSANYASALMVYANKDNESALDKVDSAVVEANNVTYRNNVGGVSGAVYLYTEAQYTQNGGAFEGNTVTGTEATKGTMLYAGAVMVKGADATFKDVAFTNNVVSSDTAVTAGGAVYVDIVSNKTAGTVGGSVTFEVTKDMTYSGNNAIGTEDEENTYGYLTSTAGGFLFLDRGTSATFNVGDSATLTIGNADATGNMDSIASAWAANGTDPTATITKTGAGTLVINSDLNKYYGKVVVEAGRMEVTKAWTINDAVTINGGTLAAKDFTFDKSPDPSTVVGSITVNAAGTLETVSSQIFSVAAGETVTDAGELSTDKITVNGGSLVLTDDVYTLDYAQSADALITNGQVVLTGKLVGSVENTQTIEGLESVGSGATLAGVTADTEDRNLQIGGTKPDDETIAYRSEGLNVGALDLGSASTVTIDGGESLGLVGVAADKELISTTGETLTVEVKSQSALVLGGSAAQGGQLNGTVNLAEETSKLVVTGSSPFVVDAVQGSGLVLVGDATSAGNLTINSLANMTGTIFVDPAWQEGVSLQDIRTASVLQVSSADAAALGAKLVAGQNALITIGADADTAANAFNSLNEASADIVGWGKSGVTAALYLGEKVNVTEGSIMVDGAQNDPNNIVTADQGTVTLAANSMLMVDSSLLTDAARPAIEGSLVFKNGDAGTAYVGIVNAAEETYYLASSIDAGAGTFQVVTDNPFITAGAINSTDGTVTTSFDAANGLGALASTGLQTMTRRADSVLAGTIADRTSIDQELNAGINLWVDVRGENYQSDDFDNGGEFDADMGYGTFGGDMAFGAFTAGAAFQYGTGSLRSSVSSIKNSIDNYAFALYGTYKVTDAFKLAAELAYVWGENDITSSQAALNQSVDTEMYSFGLRAMYELKAGNFSFVPSIGLRVSQLSTDAFQVGSVKVEDQDQTLVQVPIALRINASEFDASGWSVAPSFKIAYVPTFGDKDIEVLNHTQDVIDTAPVQADFGLRIGKDNMMFNVNMLLGAGEYGTSAIGGKVGFKYAF